MLELKNLTIYRGSLCTADAVNASFEEGKVYSVLGPNGAGKTTLISAIFGEMHYEGEIKLGDERLNFKNHFSWKKKIGYMPQDSYVDASLTALEVVLLGILHLAGRDVMQLSGGQRQMVMFASVLIKKPKILLLDEPVSALDMHHQCVLLDCVRKFTREHGITTVMILHDLSLASQFSDEVLLLSDGKIKAKGEAKKTITKELIQELYKVNVDIFYDDAGVPAVVAKSAFGVE